LLPLFMALWFAPALAVFHQQGPAEAMKASFFACLKNVVPFLLYSVILLLLAFVASIPFGLGWLVLGPVIAASLYTSYRDIFFAEGGAAPAPRQPRELAQPQRAERVRVAARVIARRRLRPEVEHDAAAPLAEEDADEREGIQRGIDAPGHLQRVPTSHDRMCERRRGTAEHEARPERHRGAGRAQGEEQEAGEAARHAGGEKRQLGAAAPREPVREAPAEAIP